MYVCNVYYRPPPLRFQPPPISDEKVYVSTILLIPANLLLVSWN